MTKKIKTHLLKMSAFYLTAIFIVAGVLLVKTAYAAPNLTVTPYVSDTDDLIGATGARWTFTATTTGQLENGDSIRFIFPVVNNGNSFQISNPTVIASTSITLYSDLGGQPLSNLLLNPSFENGTSSWEYMAIGSSSDYSSWSNVVATTTASAGAGATIVSATSTNYTEVYQTINISANTAFTVSFYAKGAIGGNNKARLFLQGKVGGACGGAGYGYMYNFSPLVWECTAFGPAFNASSTPYAFNTILSNTDWQRFSYSATTPATSTYSGAMTVSVGTGGSDTVGDMSMILDAVQTELGATTTPFNLGGVTAATAGVSDADFSGPGEPSHRFIYGFVNTTIPTATSFSATFDGITNPTAQRADLAANNLTWEVTGGTLPVGPPTQSFVSTSTLATTTAAVVRAGGNMIVDNNTDIRASAYTTSTPDVTYTFTFTPTSTIPIGGKIIIGFPFAYNGLLNNITVSDTDLISNTAGTKVASFATSSVPGFGNTRVTLVTSGSSTNPGDIITVRIEGVTNPATAGVYGAGTGGPESRFTIYTAKANGGIIDGSAFGQEEGDYTNGPAPDRAVHIGGTNNINILVYKQSGAGDVKLSDSELSQVLVNLNCPDKGFFIGQKKLATTTDYSYAAYNNVLDCNYIVDTEPNNKSDDSFYANFLVPAQKQVPAIGGVTATTSIVFGVPDASSTLMITGGVQGQSAFVQAYSSDFTSYSPIFDSSDCTTPGFSATGTGFACLNIKSGENWNFNVLGGNMGNSANFSDADGNKYWPPTIPTVYIASAGHTDLGPYAYVKADKNLTVNVLKAGTQSGVAGACIGVTQSTGGMFMGQQDMTCNINSKTFKVPLGSVTVQVGLPGYGAPQNYPVAITGNSTTKNIYVSQPTTYIAVTVQDSADNKINGAPVYANGNGSGQGMTDSNGTATIYVLPGNYIVQGFAPGLGQLTPNNVTVPVNGSASTTFIVNTADLGTVAGKMFTDTNNNDVYDGSDTPLSGVQIGAHRIDGTDGGNGTQTDAAGNYTLYLPAGTYEIGGWSSDMGGFQAASSLAVTGGQSTSLDVPLKGRGNLHITIQNASTLSPLFAGVFDPGTGRGNGTNSWTITGTSKIADLTLPAGTYNFNAGSPAIGEIVSTSTIITVGGTTNITLDANTIAQLITIGGNVANNSTDIANATVWAAKMGGGPGFFSTQTDSSGNYSLKVPANSSYRLGVKILGYIVNDISTSTTDVDKTVDFSVTAASGTISGHVENSSHVAIANAWISAKKVVSAGQMDVWTGGATDGNGSFSLNVDSGDWLVFAQAPCYQPSAGVTIAVNTSATTTLSAVSGCAANVPQLQGITPTTGGQVAKNDMNLDIPANALGTGNSTVSLSVGTTTSRTAPNAVALPNSIQRIIATDSTGQAITTLNNNASLSITYNESDLPTGFNEANLQLAYFDETTGQWEPVASTVDIDNKKITASISHFTDYAPILPNVPTAPTGLTATPASTAEIDLSWTASAPIAADYYIIYASTTALTTFPADTQIATTTSTNYSHSSLSAAQTWYYKVAGYNTNGEGWNSDRANATTQTGSCSTLTGAATYNAYPTCGAATCSSGYTLSGSGSNAVCNSNSSGGGIALNAPDCTGVTYGDYAATCFAGYQYRSILSRTPSVCTLSGTQQDAARRVCLLTTTPTTTETAAKTAVDTSNLDNNSFIALEKSLVKKINNALIKRISGRILLQVEGQGQAWYINPVNSSKYFLGRPADAFAVMRKLGLGVSNKTWATFKNGKAPARLAGRILLKVEDHGEAYYVNPVDLKMYYLGRPADAFAVMRKLGLGVTNANLRQIKVNEVK